MFFDKKKIKNFEIISFEHLIVEIENNHIAITLNRANKKNALNFVNVFLNTKFEGGRHLKRVKKI